MKQKLEGFDHLRPAQRRNLRLCRSSSKNLSKRSKNTASAGTERQMSSTRTVEIRKKHDKQKNSFVRHLEKLLTVKMIEITD